jgi:hypothetical protein
MKIDGLGAQRTIPMGDRDTGTKVAKKNSDFSSELTRNQDGLSLEKMNELLAKIDEQGAKLTQTPTYDELKSYRDLVKTFVGEAVSRMYSMQTQTGWDRQGRQKVYTTVRKVDGKLEEMAEEIRLGQSTQLSIAAKQDVIRGMLVDLYM